MKSSIEEDKKIEDEGIKTSAEEDQKEKEKEEKKKKTMKKKEEENTSSEVNEDRGLKDFVDDN